MSEALPSEHDVAEAFCESLLGDLKYDHDRKCWYRYDYDGSWKTRLWRPDTGGVKTFTEIRYKAHELSGGHHKVCRTSFIRGVETICSKWPAFGISSAAWNPDPFVLGTPGGAVDLRTGQVRPFRPHDLITKQTSVAPEDGPPELWLRFLSEATAQDEGFIRFLQQMCGYCLTGDTREHALFFVHGQGGNGKSVFLNTIMRIMGAYGQTAPMDTFISSHFDRHPTELASLQGARLVTASETEAGRSWAESRIKQLTGGDPITARFMRQDNFTFMPQMKLLIIGNKEPVLKNVDDAAKRRFNIIPFTNRPARVDRELEAKFIPELGRILRWMIEGCLDWQQNGLVRPEVVTKQTEQYFEDQDLLGQWLEESCETGKNLHEYAGTLFSSWEKFAREAGIKPGTSKAFSALLRERGFEADRLSDVSRARIYWGLRVVQPSAETTEERA